MAACETRANAGERPPTYCTALRKRNSLAGIGQQWPEVERAMGIEPKRDYTGYLAPSNT
jgi:hypothetical protein